MKAKNRDQSLSDSRELDGSYDQLTGEWASVTPVVAEWFASGQYFVEKTRFYQYFKIVLLFFACQLKELEDGQVETVHWKDKKALNVSVLHVAVVA